MNRKLLLVAAIAAALFNSCKNKEMNNPIIAESGNPYGAPAFDKITEDDYLPAFKIALEEAKADINAVVRNTEAPTFENTVKELAYAGENLNKVQGIFFNINEANTSEKMQQIAEEVSPLLTEFSTSVLMNDSLFNRVKAVYEQRESLNLDKEDARLLEETFKSFAENGANLPADKKEEYKETLQKLSLAGLKFAKNVLAATNAFVLNITDSTDIAGLPQFVIDGAALEAKNRGLNGWVITLQYPSMGPFMQYSENRALKEKVWRAYNTRAIGGEYDNQPVVKEIVELRIKAANIMGYPTYADMALRDRMAKNAENVNNFLADLLNKSLPYAKKDVEAIQKYANENGFKGKLMPWDFSYYSEKLKHEKYAINDELLKPYFKLDNVIEAVFHLADTLYGLKFCPIDGVPVYHKDVKVYDVKDANGRHMALFYADFFPRESKRGGAWMTSFREQGFAKDGKTELRPFISIVTNFTKPTETEPSLLTFDEVTTFLHEFGHALHGILAEGKYSSITGTNVARDFVELPSQIMENWATEKEYLASFAKDYKTGEVIPNELVDKIVAAKNYNNGYASVRQLSFGIGDMAWHSVTEVPSESVVDFEKRATAKVQIMPYIEGTAIAPSFSHIFSGGYSAGYYSYKWAEVLDADAFELFKEKGIFNKEVAESFRKNILSKGNLEDADLLYRNFRGRDPKPDALLKRLQ